MTPPGASSRIAPGPAPATTSTAPKGPEATSTTSGEQLAIPTKVTTPTTWEAGTSSPSTATVVRCSAAVLALPRVGGSRRTSPPTKRRRVPLPTSTTRCSPPGSTVPASNVWSDFGRSSTPPASTWYSTDTTTTTSALPRRIPRGGRIPRMASGSLWWAPGAGVSIRSRTRSPTRRSTTTTPTACSNSACTRRDTIGSLSPWRVKASPTPVLPSATERQVEQQGKGLLLQGQTAEV